jgi:hypothetical protein
MGADAQAPDYVDPVAGVRIWRVAPNLWAQLGGLLWAPSVKEPWPVGEEYVATCSSHPDHAPPQDGCTCGIYGYYSPELALQGGYWPQEGAPLYNRLVCGVVGATGEILLHGYGLLASKVKVEAIFTDGAPDAELPIPRQEIADAYDAALIDSTDYEAFCNERGLITFSPDDF